MKYLLKKIMTLQDIKSSGNIYEELQKKLTKELLQMEVDINKSPEGVLFMLNPNEEYVKVWINQLKDENLVNLFKEIEKYPMFDKYLQDKINSRSLDEKFDDDIYIMSCRKSHADNNVYYISLLIPERL